MITFQAVSKAFKKRLALDDVSLSFEVGARVALVGANGAGKTTLIRCLLGQYRCRGRLSVDGLDPRRNRESVLARIGFVPQLPPALNIPVGDLIDFAAGLCGSDPEKMRQLAQTLGLEMSKINDQTFVRLSGGQKQKLLIAIALGRDSDILVMDEPAANLDPESRKVFFRLLSECSKNTVMLMSSHRIDELASLVNRVVELDRGRVVLDEQLADMIDPAMQKTCLLRLSRVEEALAKTLLEWGFSNGETLTWSGQVAGPDRLRFFATMARYAGLIDRLELN